MGKRPAKYSAAALIKHGLTRGDWPRMWRRPEMRDSYDVVIIGAGLHGLATAYYLAENHGITNIAVVDKGYAVPHTHLTLPTTPLRCLCDGPGLRSQPHHHRGI